MSDKDEEIKELKERLNELENSSDMNASNFREEIQSLEHL